MNDQEVRWIMTQLQRQVEGPAARTRAAEPVNQLLEAVKECLKELWQERNELRSRLVRRTDSRPR